MSRDPRLYLDEDILWDVVQNRIPVLLASIEQILAAEDGSG